jgi:hypothetical protein
MRLALGLGLTLVAAHLAACEVGDGSGANASAVEDGGSSVGPGGRGGGGAGAGGSGGPPSSDDAGQATDAATPEADASITTDAATPAPNPGVPDPAPARTLPGEYGCDGCPDADVTEFELDLGNVTSQSFSGIVTGAEGNGEFFLESADGQSIGGAIATSATGDYAFTVPLFCGTQLLKCVWSNDSGQYVAVVEIVTADCVDADIRITLTWDDKGFDFELHLVKEGGRINDPMTDCTWNTCISSGVDWGVIGDASDDPRKDVDNTGNYGPENIFYPMPEEGTYTVMVEHWAAGMPDADGQVTINLLDRPPVVIPITDLAPHHVFTAATIEWPSKAVTVVGTDYDCNANWSGGCQDMIP